MSKLMLISYDGDVKADSMGRRRFSLWWKGTDEIRHSRVRGQCFFANPKQHEPFIPLVCQPGESPIEAAARMLGCKS